MTILERLTQFARDHANLPYRIINAKFWHQFGWDHNGSTMFNVMDGSLTLSISDTSLPGAFGSVRFFGRVA